MRHASCDAPWRCRRGQISTSTAPWIRSRSTSRPSRGSSGRMAAWEGGTAPRGSLARAVLLVPSALEHCVPEHVEGADVLHEVLVAMLRTCGHRTEMQDALGDAS